MALKPIIPQIDTFDLADTGEPYGMTVCLLPDLYLVYPQTEWPASVETINRCGKCCERIQLLERGLWGYLRALV